MISSTGYFLLPTLYARSGGKSTTELFSGQLNTTHAYWFLSGGHMNRDGSESVKIEKRTLDRVRKWARQEGRMLSGAIRILLTDALDRKEKS